MNEDELTPAYLPTRLPLLEGQTFTSASEIQDTVETATLIARSTDGQVKEVKLERRGDTWWVPNDDPTQAQRHI